MRETDAIVAAAERPGSRRWWVISLGATVLILGGIFAPPRLAANLLLWGWFLVGISLGSLFFIAAHQLSGSSWFVVIRRVPEALTGTLGAGVAMVIASIAFGGSMLYPWMEHGSFHFGYFKDLWLNPIGFWIRAIAYVGLWLLFARLIRSASAIQDDDPSMESLRRLRRRSAGFIVVFAITVLFSSVDWLMSLEPLWFSTMFSVYQFAGMFLAAIAAITILTVMLKRQRTFSKLVNDSHLHDLGKLLFAFSIFWMYIWYSQFMLIWYGNLPEEAMYYAGRMRGTWGILFFSVVVLEWVIPFFVLMSRKAKRSEPILMKVSIVVLAGHWLDLYVGVMYPVDGQNPVPGIWEVSVALAVVLASAGFILYSFRSAPPVPSGDPLLPESLQHHT